MSKKLKRVKKMSQLKVGDKVVVVHEPEVIEVERAWANETPMIDGESFYANYDSDLTDQTGVKVFRLPRK